MEFVLFQHFICKICNVEYVTLSFGTQVGIRNSVTEQVLLYSITLNFNTNFYIKYPFIYKNQKNFSEHVIIFIHTKIIRTFQNVIIKVQTIQIRDYITF